MNNKLKIGVLLDSYLLPAWKYSILEEISFFDFAFVSLIVMNIKEKTPLRRDTGKGSFVYRLHKKLDRMTFMGKDSYSLIINAKGLLENVPELQAITYGDDNSEEFSENVLAEIKKNNPDIILKFGFGHLTGEILNIPRYGVWSYSMDNFGTEEEGCTGYYEVINRHPATCSELVILKDGGEENRLISNVWISTCSYSIHLNRDKLFRRASLFIPRVITGISRFGNEYLEMLEEKFKNGKAIVNIRMEAPSLFQSVRNFGISLNILTIKIFKKIIYSDPYKWILLFMISDVNDFLNNSYGSYSKLRPTKDKFWADPFVIKKDLRFYVFVEEFIYRKNKGHISVLEIDESGKLLNVQTIIENTYHMSYPFIFETGGYYFMIPETGGNRTIDLYKCTYFPSKWKYIKTIMGDLNAVDTTLYFYRGKWWLFTLLDIIGNFLDDSPELYLFYSDDVLSDNWISHPCNPVVSDVRTARPAGRIFVHEGKIYRPSQDCSGRYGKAFSFNQILELSETNYKEKEVKKIEPYWDKKLKGTHTFNFDGDFKIIDAYTYRGRILQF